MLPAAAPQTTLRHGLHLFILGVVIVVMEANGVKHELRLYSDPDQQGREVVITSKIPNLAMAGNNISSILGNVESVCLTGSWSFYFKIGYKDLMGSVGHLKEPLCMNDSGFFSKEGGLQSFRYHGPLDSSTRGLTLSGQTTQGLTTSGFGREEIILNEDQEMINLPFVPSFLLFTGYSIWTGFSNNNLSGRATCYIPTTEFAVFEVGRGGGGVADASFIAGCDPKKIDGLEFVSSDYDIHWE